MPFVSGSDLLAQKQWGHGRVRITRDNSICLMIFAKHIFDLYTGAKTVSEDLSHFTIRIPMDSNLEVQEFTCIRDGFKYRRTKDYPPYLCNRCQRFLSKGLTKLWFQIQPPLSAPPKTEDV